jgi:predicted MPP superfamily phosphohydrolase
MKLSKKYPLLLPTIVLFLIILIIGYTVYDDNRVIVTQQDVLLPGLPAEFDGFTILQISDLHSHHFGESQQKLTSIINSLGFDIITFTGDMQDSRSQDILPFLEIIRGIHKKTPKFYISGNAGPFDVLYDYVPGAQFNIDISTGKELEFGKFLENEGCTLLVQPQFIQRGGARIWFAADFSPVVSAKLIANSKEILQTSVDPGKKIYEQGIIAYQTSLQSLYASFQASDVLIGVFHYPLLNQTFKNPQSIPPYDLILAGHYHGGQIRIPILGALYIPDFSLPRHGVFPPKHLVSGLFNDNNIQQYVSRGLGASSRLPFLQFRLDNTPEINLITLRRSKQ